MSRALRPSLRGGPAAVVALAVSVTASVAMSGTAFAAGATSGPYASGLYNNQVVVQTTGVNRTLQSGSAVVSLDPTGDVSNVNLAEAVSQSCTNCRTVAVAVQIVVAEASITDAEPQNGAVAVNLQCTACQTYAYARQIVLSPGHPVTFDQAELRELGLIEGGIDLVAHSPLSFSDMTTTLDLLTAQLQAAVQRDVAAAPAHDGRDVRED